MINKFRKDDYNRGYEREVRAQGDNRMPAFQLNKFQSEFNLSFNKEMAKIITGALCTNEELMQNSGKNVPTCLYALLSKLEDAQKIRYQDDDEQHNDNKQENNSYEYH